MHNSQAPDCDVIIVGGGPAGLSAALVLGRCRRSVLVIDEGNPRNSVTKRMHGFLSRDGDDPHEMLRIAREQIEKYPGVKFIGDYVESATREVESFRVRTRKAAEFTSRILLLATGIVDEVPDIDNIRQFWGSSVHLCPYCHGWEFQDQPIVVYGKDVQGAEFALEMLGWSSDLIYCTDGPVNLPREMREKMQRLGIRLEETPVQTLEGTDDQIERVVLKDGRVLGCCALFFSSAQRQCSDLARQLGCELDDGGTLIEHCDTESGIPGLYVAGNTCTGLQLVIMAAAGGTQAAFSINQALIEGDVERANVAIARDEPIPQPNTVVAS